MKRLTVNSLAWGNLKKRKKQYAALVAGIVLAMVFSSGTLFFVSCLFSSQKELRRVRYGTADCIAFELTENDLRQLAGQDPGAVYGYAHMMGFAYTEEQEEGAAVGWLDETAKEFYQPIVLEGRWPEQEGEVAAEQDALLRMGLADVQVGENFTANLLAQNGPGTMSETPTEKRYTLVGILGDKRKYLAASYPAVNPYLPALITSEKETVELGGKEALTAYIKTPPDTYDLRLSATVMRVGESAGWETIEKLRTQTIFSSILSGVLMLASGWVSSTRSTATSANAKSRSVCCGRWARQSARSLASMGGRRYGSVCSAPRRVCASPISASNSSPALWRISSSCPRGGCCWAARR